MVDEKWSPPIYKPARKLPFIPTEQEIDSLIAGCNRKTSTFLQLLKETGVRCGEAWMLRLTDIDPESRLVKVTPEKGGDPRALKMSSKLVAMLNALPKTQPEVFKGSLRHFSRSFRRQRLKVANKLQNQRILQITFHTFRHWKATMEYAHTKDILHVMKLLDTEAFKTRCCTLSSLTLKAMNFTPQPPKSVEEAQRRVELSSKCV